MPPSSRACARGGVQRAGSSSAGRAARSAGGRQTRAGDFERVRPRADAGAPARRVGGAQVDAATVSSSASRVLRRGARSSKRPRVADTRLGDRRGLRVARRRARRGARRRRDFGELGDIDLAAADQLEDDLAELGEGVVAAAAGERVVEARRGLRARRARGVADGAGLRERRAQQRAERAAQLGRAEARHVVDVPCGERSPFGLPSTGRDGSRWLSARLRDARGVSAAGAADRADSTGVGRQGPRARVHRAGAGDCDRARRDVRVRRDRRRAPALGRGRARDGDDAPITGCRAITSSRSRRCRSASGCGS